MSATKFHIHTKQRAKLFEHKMWVMISSTIIHLSQKFLILRRIERSVITHVHRSSCERNLNFLYSIRKITKYQISLQSVPLLAILHMRVARVSQEVDESDVATRWRSSGNTKRSYRLCLYHIGGQPDIWHSYKWQNTASVWCREPEVPTCSDFPSKTAAEPKSSAVTKNRDTRRPAS